MWKQVIIARKDLNMSAGKLAAQVAHASMSFIIAPIRNNKDYILTLQAEEKERWCVHDDEIVFPMAFNKETFNEWICGGYTKVVCQAKTKNNLLKAAEIAKELGMVEGVDYFKVYDNCYTELTPEEDGKTLTCIGFKPMDSDTIDKVARKFHLYIG